MATKDIKIKNVSVTFPKIKIGGKKKNDRYNKGQKKPVSQIKQD